MSDEELRELIDRYESDPSTRPLPENTLKAYKRPIYAPRYEGIWERQKPFPFWKKVRERAQTQSDRKREKVKQ